MKKRNNTVLHIIIVGLITLAGFYLVLDKIDKLRSEVKSLELALQLSSGITVEEPQGEEPNEDPEPPANNEPSPPPAGSTIVPTSIIFETQSSPRLLPQTPLTVTVENVSKATDGTVSVNLKIFTSAATSYTALEPRDIFEVVSLTDGNQKATETKGAFESMPPESTINGNVIFKLPPTQNSIILQVRWGSNIKHYEFNFTSKSYKETLLG